MQMVMDLNYSTMQKAVFFKIGFSNCFRLFFLMLVKITVLHQYYSNTSDFVEVHVLSLLFANVMSPGYAIYWVHWTWRSPKHLLFGIIA